MATGVGMRVAFVPYRGMQVAEGISLLKRKRRAVWDNVGRNKLIAGVAAGLVKSARKTLRGLGVEAEKLKLPDRSRQRVVVLAETAEQAWRLKRLLPDWEVLDAVPVEGNEAGWGNEPDPDDDPDDDPPPGRIATLVYAARYGISCDVLVRATAGTGKLCWDSFLGGNNKPGTTPALVVDIKDEAGDRERTDADVRRREYREQGLKELKVTTKQETQNQNT